MTPRRAIPVLFAIAVVIASFGNPYVIGFLTRVVAYAILAVSLDLLLGYAGLVSFGHAAFVGAGAYATGVLLLNGFGNAFLGLVTSVLAGGVLALAVGALAVRVKGIYFIMLTFAFAQMVFYLAVGQPQWGGDDGLSLPGRMEWTSFLPLSRPGVLFITAALLLVGVLVGLRRLVHSPFGMALQACRQDDVRLTTLGHSVYGHRLTAFALAGAIAGVAGFLLINLDAYLSPSLLDWRISGIVTMIVVIGGVDTLVGPVIGAFVYLSVEELTSRYTDHWPAIFGVLLVLVALEWRSGFYGLLARLTSPPAAKD